MDVVLKIQQQEDKDQYLAKPVKILKVVKIEKRSDP
jgi:hypothetical protein